MAGLGAKFPEEMRREHAIRHMTPGRVLFLHCDFTTPIKEKLVVIGATDDPPLLIVINSSIAGFIRATPHLAACQVTLAAPDHPFLKYDSYLDCAHIYESMSRDDILRQLTDDPARVKGVVSTAAREQIAAVIATARTVIPLHKGRILAVFP
jgi:hypothetical protein